jgi:hypothetical protein
MIHFFRNNPVRPACSWTCTAVLGPRGVERETRNQSCGERKHD